MGLQTPGEVVDANFGQHPFVFDIEDYMREWRTKIQAQIDRFPIGEREGEWQAMIQKWVLSVFRVVFSLVDIYLEERENIVDIFQHISTVHGNLFALFGLSV